MGKHQTRLGYIRLIGATTLPVFLSGCLVSLNFSDVETKGNLNPKFLRELDASLPDSHFTATIGSPFSMPAPSLTKGRISECRVSPALPAGLALNQTTCEISGTPTELSAEADYEIIVTSTAGIASVTAKIEVQDRTPEIAYPDSPFLFDLKQPSIKKAKSTGGAILSCAISPAKLPDGLSIDPKNCSISGTPTVLSAPTKYTVVASNATGSSVPVEISIGVTNVVPDIAFEQPSYSFKLLSDSTTKKPANSGGGITSCEVKPSLPGGMIISSSTCEISGTPSVVSGPQSYSVTPINSVGKGQTEVVTIEVQNVVPKIAYSKGAHIFNLYDSGATTGTPANSGGAITNCVIDKKLPDGLQVNPSTCAISGKPVSVTAPADYTITPSNDQGNGPSVTLSITVSNIGPQIAYSSNSVSFSLNSASSSGVPANAGGAITSCGITKDTPGLPKGLSVDSKTCEISGTPTEVKSSANYSITASNDAGSVTANIGIEVKNVVPKIAYAHSSYSFSLYADSKTDIPVNSGGEIKDCVVSPALPSGLSIDRGNCEISGTPSAVSPAANYTVTASNGVGNGASVVVRISVATVVPNIAYSANVVELTLKEASKESAPTNTGGEITKCSSDKNLPNGLSLDQKSCAIVGTPTAAKENAETYVITPSNSAGDGAGRQVSIKVKNILPKISYYDPDMVFYYYEWDTSGKPSNSGGSITNCVVSRPLPSGLKIEPTTCEIYGTPTATFPTTTIWITASNSAGSASSVQISIRVKY